MHSMSVYRWWSFADIDFNLCELRAVACIRWICLATALKERHMMWCWISPMYDPILHMKPCTWYRVTIVTERNTWFSSFKCTHFNWLLLNFCVGCVADARLHIWPRQNYSSKLRRWANTYHRNVAKRNRYWVRCQLPQRAIRLYSVDGMILSTGIIACDCAMNFTARFGFEIMDVAKNFVAQRMSCRKRLCTYQRALWDCAFINVANLLNVWC